MKAELITIGDEILIGQIINTNAVFLAQTLNKIGIEIAQITTISDEKASIVKALNQSKERAQLIVLTGGLGPTKDDVTKHTLCEYFEDQLVQNQEILDHIEEIFRKYISTPITQENRHPALLPQKAKILKNHPGTASGMWFEKEDQVIVSLPGVPFEMKSLMTHQVIPAVKKHFKRPFILHRTLITYGLGESAIAHRIAHWENALPEDIKLAYLPNLGRVRLRLFSSGIHEEILQKKIDTQIEKLRPLIEDIFVGFEEETSMEAQIQYRFITQNKTLAVAESCTGGEIAHRMTQIPGASQYFKGGVVTYQTETKTHILGVPAELIQDFSVVSKEVAEAMAQGVKEKMGSSLGIATTGNAGPTKGDSDAEIGTVWIGIATDNEVYSEKFLFGKHRKRVVGKAVNKALELVYKELLKTS
ncbi:MAG: competence/damage-inducible protein A [Flavobacteriaceae bacterium]